MNGLLEPIITALPFYRIPEAYNGATSDQTPFYFQKDQCLNDCHYGTITDRNHLPSFIIKVPKSYGINIGTPFDFELMCADGSNATTIVTVKTEIISIITPAEKLLIQAAGPTVGDAYLVDIGDGTYQNILWGGGIWIEGPIHEIPDGQMYFISSENITYLWKDGVKIATNCGFQLCDIGDYTYFIYNGFEVEDLPCGFSQINILFDITLPVGESKRFMSELIDVREFNILDNEYHKLEVSNSCALGNIPFANTIFNQIFYFHKDTLVGEPENSISEGKEEDGLGNEILVYSRVKKLFILDSDYVPEYIVDFFFFTTQNDDIHLTFPFETTNSDTITSQYKGRREINSDTMEVSGDWNNVGCYNQVTLKFGLLDDIVKTACCQQLDKEGCLLPLFEVIKIAQAGEQAEIEASDSLEVGDCYLIANDTNPIGVGWTAHKKEIACWNGAGWDYTLPLNDMVIKDLSIITGMNLYFYDVNDWHKFGELHCGLNNTSASFELLGHIPTGTIASIFIKKSTDILFTFYGNVEKDDLKNIINVTGLDENSTYDVKAKVISNNCDYGLGDTIQCVTEDIGGS